MFPTRIAHLLRKSNLVHRSVLTSSRYQHKSAAEPFLNGSSSNYVEDIYAAWLKDPNSVHKSWDVYFRGVLSGASLGFAYSSPPTLGFEHMSYMPVASPSTRTSTSIGIGAKSIQDHLTVQTVIRSYQIRGHLA
ncbi:unnamed protein product, partial [Hymenolepis diminuta]